MIVDLFAGPGGWSEALRMLGRSEVGIELDAAACQTRAAAGHLTIRADVATYPLDHLAGKVEGLIASPPCQSFSLAGKRAGLDSARGQLVYEVLRWTKALRPAWVACEQVPPVEGIWRSFAHEMRGWGYGTWVGLLNAADYGVPQTRRRAFLLARLDSPVGPPEPTHSQSPAAMFDRTLEPWITMAAALGWGMSERPSVTVMAKGSSGGGSAGFLDGGSGARARLAAEQREQRWIYQRPATTVVGSFCPDVIAAPGYRTDVSRQNAPGSVKVTIEEAGVLQSFRRDYPWSGPTTKQYQQVGNAVPPLLAACVLKSVMPPVPLARSPGETR